jgi:hypothetical protein
MNLFQPQAVFILGDIFDEGLIASPHEFEEYVERFHQLFYVPKKTQRLVIVGNHDIGFHDRVVAFEPYLRQRFEDAFDTKLVQLLTVRGIKFVTINSMALEGDDCQLCERARKRLIHIGRKLASCPQRPCQRPVLLTHFPLYRESDEKCNEPDAASTSEKRIKFQPKLDCISEEASKFIIETINPRLIFSGHTHNGCVLYHGQDQATEWTVASFSWRNRADPSFLLVLMTPEIHSVSKCFLPNEKTQITIYGLSFCVALVILFMAYRVQKRDKQL